MKQKYKKILSLFIVLSVFVSTTPTLNAYTLNNNVAVEGVNTKETVVNIQDPELEKALIKNNIEKPITIEKLSERESLDLSNNNITNIQELQFCTSLKHLYLGNNKVSDISPLKGLKSLESLNLESNEISNISPLEDLTSLTYLYLNSNQISDDINSLKDLKSLTTLYLNNNQISDITALDGLTSLTYLYLNNNQIDDISSLKNLTSLINLNLDSNKISDLSPLEDFKSLSYLFLDSNKISKIDPLENITSLISLNLNNNDISDINSLGGLKSLSTLYLSNNKLSEISSLENLTSLTSLVLHNNEIAYITPLKELTSLTTLDLSSNNISNITHLDKLTSLDTLSLDSNKISDINPLKSVTSLSYLYMDSNRISDISPLKEISSLEYSSVTDQLIDLSTVTLKSNEYQTETPIKLFNGDKLTLNEVYNITPTGNYDGNGNISWKNLNETGTLIYNFKHDETKIIYNGLIKQDYTVKTSGGGNGGGSVDPDPDPKPPIPPQTVILASGDKYSDVLTASVLANEKKAPILLSQKDSIDEKTLSEIKRLNTGEIIITGGTDSVSDKVVGQLNEYTVTRIAGQDRFKTAESIGNEIRKITGKKSEIILVDGTNFPDAITISTLASQKRVPILLTEPNTLTKSTKDTIKTWGINDITIGGGYNSVSNNIEDNLGVNKISRLAGSDRYETAELIGNEFRKVTGNTDNIILADGTNFPDALTVNTLSSKFKAPIMLTEPTKLNSITSNKIGEWSIKSLLISGGYNSISKEIEDNLKVDNKERIAGVDRYETAVKISKKLTILNP
nr:leucine-rich repeat domain-containing protein [Clostridioides sp.]